ncbi:hypothetical protein P262_p1083 (plasmid) [Cronobacter malonaticus]|uniref:Uncharacterized protein n=1 Tax=Cronobacter malonaticus TaxID=413503 RepID=V5U6C1_9ENTR|nr:hypothetical protein P262_p1083 [Cronobacter malonaticus]
MILLTSFLLVWIESGVMVKLVWFIDDFKKKLLTKINSQKKGLPAIIFKVMIFVLRIPTVL